jgi:hypothetical protein
MNEPLPNCPFCGRAGEVVAHEYWPKMDTEICYEIGCRTEGCICEVGQDLRYYKTRQEAIDAWSKRA